MDGPWGIVVIFGVIGVTIALAIIAYRQETQRREALATLAAQRGWSFDPSHDTQHDEQYAQFGCFSRGHSRSAYNTIEGAVTIAGRRYPLKMGDFLYKVTSSNGKQTTTSTHRFSYLILHLPFAGVPDLLIRREGMLDKIAGALGFDDIDFESEAFSRRFHVKSRDKKFAYDVIHPRMMEFLMDGGGATDAGWLEIEHGAMCITNGAGRWDPAEFEAKLAWAERFLSLWPDYLVEQLGGRPSEGARA